MPTWTQDQLSEYLARRAVQDPQPEPAVCDEPVGSEKGEDAMSQRTLVRITSYRKRLLDPDNLTGGAKYLIDGIRHAGLISDDRPEDIELVVAQQKVSLSTQERTEIEIRAA